MTPQLLSVWHITRIGLTDATSEKVVPHAV